MYQPYKLETLALLSIIQFLLVLGYIFSLGFYSLASLAITTSIFWFLILFWLTKTPQLPKITTSSYAKILTFILIFSIVFNLYSLKSPYENINVIRESQLYIYLLALAVSSTYLLDLKKQIFKFRLPLLILLVVTSRILIIENSPAPHIDTFDIIQNATSGILTGQNPYTMVFTQLYPDKTPNYYTYFPLSFLLTIPAWLLFGDIRYTFAVAELVFCAVLYSLGRKNPSVPNQREIYNFLILIFLFHPLGTFIIEESWLDPLILALLAVFGLGYISSKKTAWPFLLISTTIGIKQNMLMIIPFLFKLKSFDFKKLILGFLPVILVILFFFLLSPSNFISDTIIEPYTRTQRSDALTLFSFLKNQGIILPSIVSLSIPFVFLILFLKKGWSSIANFYLAFTIWFFSSLLFFREAFLNQYYFASSLLLLSIAFALNEYNS